ALYKDNNVSMTGGIGCLPIIIQFPVFAALYAAIQYSPELHQGLFLGINLAKPSILLAAISFLVYLLQGWLGTLGVAPEQRKMMRSMMIVSPLMILFFTFSSPGGLGLYFAVGGVFACIQT
ncbi:YidC/Oxa1 family membrane protein insertase, partial [Enterococcus faecium]|nr:YidC/Oxa1 family membrane protein insertase [Enterococcus faecium]